MEACELRVSVGSVSLRFLWTGHVSLHQGSLSLSLQHSSFHIFFTFYSLYCRDELFSFLRVYYCPLVWIMLFLQMHVLKKALKDKGTGKPGGINKTNKSQETLETYKFTASLSRLNKQQKFLEREDSVTSQVAYKLYRELQGHRFSKSSPYWRGLFHDMAVHLCVIHVALSKPLPKLRLGTPIIRLVYQGGLDGFIPLVCYGA